MRRRLLIAVVVLASAGCLVQDVNLEGKGCSTNHPCSEGYQCVAGQCLLPEHVPAADAGSDAGSSCPDGGPADAGCP